uniref:Skp1-related protein n=1 Tax=Caenorhabditis tropicalis TaxID=1561998 RepID=A0A1I7V527_9PELO
MACEMSLLFKDSKNPIILRDTDLIKKIPVLSRAIEAENPAWETKENVRVSVPIDIPFPKESGVFIFENIRKYISPKETKDDIKVENYPEANKKSLTELKSILELANFMECTSFMHCIAFVIARHLDSKNVDEIADYCGIEMEDERIVFQREDGWAYPPSEIFRNN